ncbi:InlB B-repeat-containing protein [Prevotella sp. E13-17]|uniref:InlB B-repeat-containing protein n=1 Tax=Prevotella sp. E13-17 TaxID=2913616 RepID=UPI001EDA1883|nr:InlB B-repeat-containing protein [Prevotella sp. E13-17]UKK50792.1 InlB B-repeat-containing protein [Prevotella sp. E13-17]
MKQIRILSIMAMVLWASALSAQSHWQCDINANQSYMSVYFHLTDGTNVYEDTTPYEVAAFVGEECRGVATFEQVVKNEITYKYGLLQIRCDGVSEETAYLKVYNKLTQEEKRIYGAKIALVDGGTIGEVSTPVQYDIIANTPKYQVTGTPNDEVMGTVTGSGIYEEEEIAHLKATANTGYHFVKWSNDETNDTCTFAVMKATELQAIFAPNQHLLTFISEGDTVRSELQDYNSTIVLPENPSKEGYSFTKWTPSVASKMPNNPLTYEAQFQINEYTMTYVVDGQEIRWITKNYGESIPATSAPTKTGFTFAGWDPEVPATIPGSNMTFTAQWTRNKYVAKFISEGEIVKSDSVLYEDAISLPEDPQKKGYTFSAWTPVVPENMPAENQTFTAQFTINQYQVKFMAKGEAVVNQKQDYATAIVIPQAPAKEGHTFKGWEPEVPELVPDSDVVFTAQYTPNKYLAKFTSEGETVKSDSVVYATAITKPTDPQKVGYTFAGWTPVVPETMPASDQNFTAQFTINQYTMTFVLNNGEENVMKEQDYNSDLTAPVPTKTGYTFKGWDTAVPAKVPAENKSFTAQWEAITYTISYDLDGGAMPEGVTNATTYTIESQPITLDAPIREGYTFAGWTGTGLNEATTSVIIATGSTENRSYKATWTINQYTMTFVLNNGEENVLKVQDYNSDLTAPVPTKTGYTFKGWDTQVPSKVPAENKSFTAQWEAITYSISYDLDGGAMPEGVTNATTYTIESQPITLNAPIREGYTFAGWTGTGLNEATTSVIIATGSTENRSYKATWTINQYTMTFVLNNGEENVVKVQDYNSDLTAPVPTKTGYTFKGWDTQVPSKVPAENKSFTAQWEAITYSISYDLDGGAMPEGVTNATTYTIESQPITLNAPIREGYTFAGWTGTGLNEATTSVIIATGSTENRSYKATWTINQYTMTFVLNNGEENVVKVQDYNSDLTAPVPTKTGYTFKGWDTAVPAKVPAENKSFTAQWEAITYSISYDLDGGAMPEGVTNATTYTIESQPITLNAPIREGYTFAGWTGTGLNEATTSVIIATGSTENRSYKATWTINQYTMTFVLNNGEENVVKVQDYNSDLTAPVPTKTGYTFKGWDTQVPSKVPAENKSFTAQWEAITYSISYDLDGGAMPEGVTNATTYTIESQPITLNAPIREGYTFAGWTGTGLNEATTSVIIATGSTENRSYKATWTVNQYTITFTANGETIKTEALDFGATITAPEAPDKEGHTFKGWNPELTVGATMPAHDVTYDAVYTANKYKVTWVVDGQESENEVTYATSITKPTDPVKEGYTFTGWTPEIPDSMPAFNLTFTAQFTVNQYAVTFTADGVTIKTDSLDYGSVITPPTAPEKEGHTFTGWNPTLAEGTTVPAHDVTYDAVYTFNKYNVIYIVNGQEWARDPVEYGATIVLRQYTAEEGYTFNGWVSDQEYKTMPAHDITYTADITSGIEKIFAGCKYVTVYTLNGTLVSRQMPLQQVLKLPSGLYIINTKRLFIK